MNGDDVSGPVFIDSNVLVYWADRDEPAKRAIASAVGRAAIVSGRGVISTQVVGEFIRATSRGRALAEQRRGVAERGREIIRAWPVHAVDARVVELAIAYWERFSISYWDAQILASARCAGCQTILTEDDHHSQLDGVKYINPFVPGFDVEAACG